MTTEIVRRDDAALAEKIEWAKFMQTANLLPRDYRNNPGNLLFAAEYADTLGVSRINAITSIHVIEGKPSASAELIAGLVRRAGHKLRVTGDDTQCIAQIIRSDDPDFTYEARWDARKAQAAGLWGRGNWSKYPGAMLRSRAITEVARMAASDVLFGVVYTPEELGAEVDVDGNPLRGERITSVEQVSPAPGATTAADRMRGFLSDAPTPQTGEAEGSQAETPVAGGEAGSIPAGNPSASSTDDMITSAQLKKLGAGMRDVGLNDRASALAYVADVIGREITSRNELTKDEASRVIDALEKDQAAVVDGELIDDPTPASAAPEGDALWAQVVAAGRDYGLVDDLLTDDIKNRVGVIAQDATDEQLQQYLEQLQAEGVQA